MSTHTRQHGTKVTVAESPAERIAAFRAIVAERQYAKIDGTMIDGFSASAVVQVYAALNEANRAKFAALPAGRMAIVAFKLIKKAGE